MNVSISSKLVDEPVFHCNSDPQHLVASFIGAMDGLVLQSKAQMELLFFDNETAIKVERGCILEKLTERHNGREQTRKFELNQNYFENENCASTQLLQTQKNQLFHLQESLNPPLNVFLLFGFKRTKYDLKLFKLFWLPILANERDNEFTVIKQISSSPSILVIFSYWI